MPILIASLIISQVRQKLVFGEYVVLLVTFISIILWGMDLGFLFGLISATANFVFSYAIFNPHAGGDKVTVSARPRSRQLRRPDHVSETHRFHAILCIYFIGL